MGLEYTFRASPAGKVTVISRFSIRNLLISALVAIAFILIAASYPASRWFISALSVTLFGIVAVLHLGFVLRWAFLGREAIFHDGTRLFCNQAFYTQSMPISDIADVDRFRSSVVIIGSDGKCIYMPTRITDLSIRRTISAISDLMSQAHADEAAKCP